MRVVFPGRGQRAGPQQRHTEEEGGDSWKVRSTLVIENPPAKSSNFNCHRGHECFEFLKTMGRFEGSFREGEAEVFE
jgi:hypothetical protein